MTSQTIASIAIPILIAGLYVVVCWALAEGGWRWLHADYPARGPRPRGEQWRFRSVDIGSTTYQGSMRIIATEEGLYLHPHRFPLGLFPVAFHRPVMIPWAVARPEEAPNVPRSVGVRLSVDTRRGPLILVFLGAPATAIRQQYERRSQTA